MENDNMNKKCPHCSKKKMINGDYTKPLKTQKGLYYRLEVFCKNCNFNGYELLFVPKGKVMMVYLKTVYKNFKLSNIICGKI